MGTILLIILILLLIGALPLALQFGLGVLSQRRIGPDPDYPVDPVADGAVLKFWALAGSRCPTQSS